MPDSNFHIREEEVQLVLNEPPKLIVIIINTTFLLVLLLIVFLMAYIKIPETYERPFVIENMANNSNPNKEQVIAKVTIEQDKIHALLQGEKKMHVVYDRFPEESFGDINDKHLSVIDTINSDGFYLIYFPLDKTQFTSTNQQFVVQKRMTGRVKFFLSNKSLFSFIF